MKRFLGLGLVIFAAACGAAPEGEEPLAVETEALTSFPKGQIALVETSHSAPVDLFTSWGWVYHKSPSDEVFELLSEPSRYPRALAALRLPPVCRGQVCDGTRPRQCVAWIDNVNVRAKCESPVLGWGADFTLSSINVGAGQIRRLVAVSEPRVSAPALLALNTANQVLVNWHQNGAWQGWCVARTLHSSIDVIDFAATQRSSGSILYKVNVYDPLTSDAVFFDSTIATPFSCPNASGNLTPRRLSRAGYFSRIAIVEGATYSLHEDGEIFAVFDVQGARSITPPRPFQSLAARLIERNAPLDPDQHPPGVNRDALYGIATDGTVWEAVITHSAFPPFAWTEVL